MSREFLISEKKLVRFIADYHIDCVRGGSNVPLGWLKKEIKRLRLKAIKKSRWVKSNEFF